VNVSGPAHGRRRRHPVFARRLIAVALSAAVVAVVVIFATSGSGQSPKPRHRARATRPVTSSSSTNGTAAHGATSSSCPPVTGQLPGMPAVLDPCDIYSADSPGNLTGPARRALPLVYAPNALSNSVTEIDPATYKVVRTFATGFELQHVVPSWDLSTLWVTNDVGNSLTPIDPTTGLPGKPVPVADPYNLYFTPDGRYAIVVAEALDRLDFRDPHTMALDHSLPVNCPGVDHMDFSADGTYLIASCEFAGELLKVDVPEQKVVGILKLPSASDQPQDVKLSPDGKIFYVADLKAGGVWEIDGPSFTVLGFLPTANGAHGLYVSRDDKYLYVSNRDAGSVSLVDFATRTVAATWQLPDEAGASLGSGIHASPDMGGVSDDGRVLWLSGRYDSDVYAIDTTTGQLIARVPVGNGPHGVCVWPQPGRYSLGHTGILR
jgi:YVTN family beta-propeller protein